MSAYVGKSGSIDPAADTAPEAAPAEVTAAVETDSGTQTWAHGWSSAQYQRAATAFTGVLYTAAAGALAIVGAYIVLYGMPASIASSAPWHKDLVYSISAAFRALAAPEFRAYIPLVLLAPIVYLLLFRQFGLLVLDGELTPFSGFRRLVRACAIGGAAIALLGAVLSAGPVDQGWVHAGLFYACAALLTFSATLLCHSGYRIALLSLRHAGIGRTRVAVLGNAESVRPLEQALADRAADFDYIGLVTTRPTDSAAPANVLGDCGDLDDLINEHRVEEIILAFDPSEMDDARRLRIAQICWRLGVDLKMVSPFHPYFKTPGRTEILGDTPLVHVERTGLYSTRSQIVKRAIDIVLSATGLVVISPLLAFTALAVKLDSRGPVLFSQTRPGLYGRVFRIHKFRSMRADADGSMHREAQRKLILEGAATELTRDGRPIFGKVPNDPRVTRVGRFIRRTSIDELPQLFNVLKGEMSLVGPRPSVLYELEDYSERHRARLNCRPGITGLWQVSGRSRLSFEQMVDLDLKYISSWSIWLDIKILIRTIPVVLRIDQAY